MRAHGLKVLVIAALSLMVVASISGQTPQHVAKTAQIARGGYLVNIAGCPDCHTPMNDKGEFVPGQTLKGTKLFFGPPGEISSVGGYISQHCRTRRLGHRERDQVADDGPRSERTSTASADATIPHEPRRRHGSSGVSEVAEVGGLTSTAASHMLLGNCTCPLLPRRTTAMRRL